MKSAWLLVFLNIFIRFGLSHCSNMHKAHFFTQKNFKGVKIEVNVSSECRNIPSDIKVGWSVKSPGCIAVFRNNACVAYNFGQWDFVSKPEAGYLGDLRKSYRGCTSLEEGPEVNLDYYAESERKGQRVELRDICSCTNLPVFPYVNQSINTYGNYFIFYNEPDCRGSNVTISDLPRYTHYTVSSKRSVIPMEITRHCSPIIELGAMVLKFEPIPDVSLKKAQKELIAQKITLVNNSSNQIEHTYESRSIISEYADIQFAEVLNQIKVIQIRNTTDFSFAPDFTSPSSRVRLEEQLRSRLVTSYQLHSPFWPVIRAEFNDREIQVKEMFIVPPCTTYEVAQLAEVVDMNYRIHLSITGHMGQVRARSDDFRESLTGFKNLSIMDDYTVLAESTAKLKLNYVGYPQFILTSTPIPDCRSHFLTMTSIIIKVEPKTDMINLQTYNDQVPVTDQEIFIHNGAAPQEYSFNSTKQILEMGHFEFPTELNQIKFLSIAVNLESPLPFLTKAWEELRTRISSIFQNRQNLNEQVKYDVQSNKTFHFQKQINVPPCTKYQVNSLIEIAWNIEMEYRVQLQVTGKREDKFVGVDEIQKSLKGLKFLRSENNQTALAETTIKLRATFGVSSGINAEGRPINDCLEARAAKAAYCKFVSSG